LTRSRDVATQGGLVLVSSTTIPSAVSFVVVNNAFSSTYDNYRILLSGGTASTVTNIFMKFGSTTSGYGYWLSYRLFNGGTGDLYSTNASYFPYFAASDSDGNSLICDVSTPCLSKSTYVSGVRGVDGAAGFYGGCISATTSYTDFTLTMESGTMTGGTIQVYGYKK